MEGQHLKHTYVPAFDGLRAFVLVVIVTHLETTFFPIVAPHRRLFFLLFSQVWFALNVFFVLSGFLITWLLSNELRKTGDLDLLRFYKRRTARLLPAYLTAITAATIVALCWGHAPREIFQEMIYFLTYTYNMFVSLPGVTAPVLSMFLVPAWSLCVEEQFYLGWSFALKRLTMRRALPAVIWTLIALRIYRCALFFWMRDPGLRLNRFYYGTDTRIDAILIGCAAALALQNLRYYEMAQKYLKMRSLPYLLPVAIAITLFFTAREQIIASPAYQAYGAEISNLLLTAWIVSIFFQPNSFVTRMLASPPVVFIGKISYGLYIFHLIVLQVVARALGTNDSSSIHRNLEGWTIVTIVSILFATAHYYLIEKPLIDRAKHPGISRLYRSPAAIST